MFIAAASHCLAVVEPLLMHCCRGSGSGKFSYGGTLVSVYTSGCSAMLTYPCFSNRCNGVVANLLHRAMVSDLMLVAVG